MSKPKFILSTEELNTRGIRLLTAGAKTEQFLRNPVMLYMHKEGEVIGRWENLRIEDNSLVADADFDMEDDFAKKIAGKVSRGYINAASVSARPLKWHLETENGNEIIVFSEWELRETSVVDIPSNRSSLRLLDANDVEIKLGEGIKLSDIFPVPLKTTKSMDLKQFAKELNLSDTATEAEILEAIKKSNGALVELSDLKTKQVEARKAEAIALVNDAVSTNRLDAKLKEGYLKLADTDFDLFKATIEGLPKSVKIMDAARSTQATNAPKGREAWSFADWQEKDGNGLYEMAKNSFAQYEQLFEAEFGTKPNPAIA